jgi:hypothetical protein
MEQDVPAPVFVGIDGFKDRLDIHLLPSGRAFSPPDDQAGMSRLFTRLAGTSPTLALRSTPPWPCSGRSSPNSTPTLTVRFVRLRSGEKSKSC